MSHQAIVYLIVLIPSVMLHEVAHGVVALAFGDDTAFDTTSLGLPGITRSFTSFQQAADEAGQSRIYGGIHYQFSNQDGLAAGRALGTFVLDALSQTADTRPPQVLITSSVPAASAANLTIQGQVLDALSAKGVEADEVAEAAVRQKVKTLLARFPIYPD